MGKASRTKVEVNRREKIAAQRAAERRAEQRRRILMAAGSVVVVLAIVLTFVIIKLNSKPSAAATSPSASASPQGLSNGPTGAALSTLVNTVTSVPASTLNAVGSGGGAVTNVPIKINGTALSANGKPEMLYMGAEYCPYCAAERWAMIVALSRFGTFSGLATVHSAVTDGGGNQEPYPDTPTFTFVHATYTSKYLTFTPVELNTNIPDSSTGGYTTLQTPTSAQQALMSKWDNQPYIPSSEPAGSIPFIYFGGKSMIVGTSPAQNQALQGVDWNQIAADLHNPNSAVARAEDGEANYITAAICKMTGNQPASACTATVQALESQL
jgi:thiol-disulfide isomerase/thioredoxin